MKAVEDVDDILNLDHMKGKCDHFSNVYEI
jgi:hypothetical protein